MIRLDTVNRSLTLFLGGAQATAPLQIVVSYSDQTSSTYLGSTQLTDSNGTTVVTICSAPVASVIRDIDMVTVLNTDSVSQVVTIQLIDTATAYKIISVTLLVGDKLTYTHGSAWQVVNNAGNIKYSVLSTSGVDSFSGGSTGLTPVTATTGAVTLGGTLAVASGGTGTSSPALVAGTNVTITGTWPNQTINSSNTGGTVTNVAALTLGTTGTDVSSTVANSTTTPVITLNLPTASATNRGALSAADWTTFNNKGSGTVTSVSGTSGRITSTGGTTPVIDLTSGIATPGTTGSASLIPVVTIDTYGRVTSITTAANPQGTVTSVTGTSPVTSSGGTTPAISLAASYGDTQNPYASKTANYVLAAPNGTSGVPTFRAIVAADVPTLNQNTTGTASNVTGTVAVVNGGTGATTASGARTNLSAAQSGANTDITSIALTTGTISTAPSASTDIVNKSYADSIATGVNFHAACNLATTTALPANTYNNGSSGVGATLTATSNAALVVDSVTVTSGQRILVKNESTSANNGVYTVTQVGSGALPYILTRATDYDTSGTGTNEIDIGDLLLVLSGTVNANTSWVQQTPLPITVGTTALVFIQFAAVQTYTAGTGLTLATNQFSITNVGTAGTYGSATQTPVMVTNAQGQVTSVTNTTITPAVGSITGLGANVATFLTTPSSANLAAAVTDETGSGSLVFATSPSLVTPALGTPASGNFSTGTFTWPTFNQNTTGSAGSVANALTSGTGISFSSGTTYNGSAAITVNNSLPMVYPSSGIPNSTGTAWGTSYSTTGSGTVVALATSPSFTTPILGTPTSGNFSTGSFTWPTFNQNTTGNAATATSATTATNIAAGANLQIPYQTGSGATSFIAAPTISSTYLQYNGTGFTWASAAGIGTVTSVAATVPSFLSISGSPITTSGTLAITYSGTALPIANGGTGQTTASAAFNALSPITTTGDLIIGNGTNSATRLGIGANGYVLTSNGTTASWAAGGGGSSITISNDTSTASNLYPAFFSATSGTASTVYTSNAKLLYKPSTGELQASEVTASNGLLLNATTVASSYTIGAGFNAMSVGPVTVASGQAVTITSGQRWLVF